MAQELPPQLQPTGDYAPLTQGNPPTEATRIGNGDPKTKEAAEHLINALSAVSWLGMDSSWAPDKVKKFQYSIRNYINTGILPEEVEYNRNEEVEYTINHVSKEERAHKRQIALDDASHRRDMENKRNRENFITFSVAGGIAALILTGILIVAISTILASKNLENVKLAWAALGALITAIFAFLAGMRSTPTR